MITTETAQHVALITAVGPVLAAAITTGGNLLLPFVNAAVEALKEKRLSV